MAEVIVDVHLSCSCAPEHLQRSYAVLGDLANRLLLEWLAEHTGPGHAAAAYKVPRVRALSSGLDPLKVAWVDAKLAPIVATWDAQQRSEA